MLLALVRHRNGNCAHFIPELGAALLPVYNPIWAIAEVHALQCYM